MRHLVVDDVTGEGVVSGRHGWSWRSAWETLGTKLGIGDAELTQRLAAAVGDREGEGGSVADVCVGIFVAAHQGAVQNCKREWQGRSRKLVGFAL